METTSAKNEVALVTMESEREGWSAQRYLEEYQRMHRIAGAVAWNYMRLPMGVVGGVVAIVITASTMAVLPNLADNTALHFGWIVTCLAMATLTARHFANFYLKRHYRDIKIDPQFFKDFVSAVVSQEALDLMPQQSEQPTLEDLNRLVKSMAEVSERTNDLIA